MTANGGVFKRDDGRPLITMVNKLKSVLRDNTCKRNVLQWPNCCP